MYLGLLVPDVAFFGPKRISKAEGIGLGKEGGVKGSQCGRRLRGVIC